MVVVSRLLWEATRLWMRSKSTPLILEPLTVRSLTPLSDEGDATWALILADSSLVKNVVLRAIAVGPCSRSSTPRLLWSGSEVHYHLGGRRIPARTTTSIAMSLSCGDTRRQADSPGKRPSEASSLGRKYITIRRAPAYCWRTPRHRPNSRHRTAQRLNYRYTGGAP